MRPRHAARKALKGYQAGLFRAVVPQTNAKSPSSLTIHAVGRWKKPQDVVRGIGWQAAPPGCAAVRLSAVRAAAAHTTMAPMNLRNILSPLGHRAWCWWLDLRRLAGRGGRGGGLVINRPAAFHAAHERDEKRAPTGPWGMGSAVMLNARLKPGVNLMHVIKMAPQSLGERLSGGKRPARGRPLDGRNPIARDLRIYANGRLQKWTLERPQAEG